MFSRVIAVASALLACSVAQAEPVVKVLVFKGAPTVVVQDKRSPARPGLALGREDQIEVPANSWLVLQILKNGFAVKIDEDLVMPVKDIALLDSPAKAPSIDEQLQAMARAREIDLHDRVTGYQNRKVAGQGALKADAEREAPAAEESANVVVPRAPAPAPPPPPAPGSPPARAPAEASPAPSPKAEAKKDVAVSTRPLPPPAKKRAKAAAPPTFAWSTLADGKLTPQSGPLDEAIAEAVVQAKVAECIAAAWKAAGLKPPKSEGLLLRRVDGAVQARLASRLALDPACSAALASLADRLPDRGWLRVEIGLAGP